jgi:hypothetical protein
MSALISTLSSDSDSVSKSPSVVKIGALLLPDGSTGSFTGPLDDDSDISVVNSIISSRTSMSIPSFLRAPKAVFRVLSCATSIVHLILLVVELICLPMLLVVSKLGWKATL